jgi:hypothetical protein
MRMGLIIVGERRPRNDGFAVAGQAGGQRPCCAAMPLGKPMDGCCSRRDMLRWLAALPLAAGARGTEDAAAPPALPDPDKGVSEGWTMVLLPDTQNYAKYARNQANFERMTEWVRDHGTAWNIRLALHVGDLVEQNDIEEGGGPGFGDQPSASQWASARRALGKLHGVIPVVLATGNHDYGVRRAEDRRTRFNSYFGLTDNRLVCDGRGGGIWVESAPNAFGARTLENAAYDVRVPGGGRWLVLSLEWGPRKAVVDWALDVARRPAYADHDVILLTHSYLLDSNIRSGQTPESRANAGNPHRYGTGQGGDTHDGEDLWQALVRRLPRARLVVSGHEMGRHTGYRVDVNDAGRSVHQMLFNAQGLGGGSDERGNGGDGWMRLLTFEPDGRRISVRTFSPLRLAQGQPAYWDHPDWRFTLEL